jgi:hypothetical protein
MAKVKTRKNRQKEPLKTAKEKKKRKEKKNSPKRKNSVQFVC